MNSKRRCAALTNVGEPCDAAPLLDSECCLVHDPAHREEMAEWRRLGGLHRRREASLSTIYDVGNIASVPGLWRILQIAALATLALENSGPRNRTLITVVTTGAKLLEVGDLEVSLQRLEETVARQVTSFGRN